MHSDLSCLGFDIIWEGKGMNEIGREKISGKKLIRVNSQFFRPAEVEVLWGNPEKAEKGIIPYEKYIYIQKLENWYDPL